MDDVWTHFAAVFVFCSPVLGLAIGWWACTLHWREERAIWKGMLKSCMKLVTERDLEDQQWYRVIDMRTSVQDWLNETVFLVLCSGGKDPTAAVMLSTRLLTTDRCAMIAKSLRSGTPVCIMRDPDDFQELLIHVD